MFSIVDAISDKKGTTIMTSCKKLELILVFSIADAILDKKGTTITTSPNNCDKKVRQEGKKSGKISDKNPGGVGNQPGKPFGQVVHFNVSDIGEKSQEGQVPVKIL